MPSPFGFPKEAERLLKRRVVLLGTPIDEHSAKMVMAQILYLSKEHSSQPIQLVVNSPGGFVADSLAIYDLLRQSATPIHTHCLKTAHGMAALLVAAGVKGQRTCGPDSRFQMVPIRGNNPKAPLAAIDLEVLENQVADQFAQMTGRELGQVLDDMSQERILAAVEAVQYGLVDSVRHEIPGVTSAL